MKEFFAAIMSAILAFFGGTPAAPVDQPQQIVKETKKDGVVLTLDSRPVAVKPNTPLTVTVSLETKGRKVSAAEVHLAYDVAKVKVTNVTIGSYLPVVLQKPVYGNGTISFVVGVQPQSPATGVGTIATITLQGKTPSSSQLAFANTTKVAALGSNDNVVGSMHKVTITVNP